MKVQRLMYTFCQIWDILYYLLLGQNMKQHECAATQEKKDKQREYVKQWRLANPDKRKAQRQREYLNSQEKLLKYAQDYRKENPDKVKAATNKWVAENKEYIREKRKEKYQTNAVFCHSIKAFNSARHKRLRRSIAKWQCKKELVLFFKTAQAISKDTGIMHHVDHIIPLNGKLVSGLTVIANLAIITGSENSKKNNYYCVEDIV